MELSDFATRNKLIKSGLEIRSSNRGKSSGSCLLSGLALRAGGGL